MRATLHIVIAGLGAAVVLAAAFGQTSAPAAQSGRLAFMTARSIQGERNNDIYVVNADGSGLRNVTHSPRVFDILLGWSPQA